MNTAIAAFTNKGIALAQRLKEYLDAGVFVPERLAHDGLGVISPSLSEWTGKVFHEVSALIFIGACGIAVRAVASHVESKLSDPAVIVIDEAGKFVIPILSGHIGGANELARKIACCLHAQAVITTATDINNLPAVDEWAVKNNCAIENPEAIKRVSGALLEGWAVPTACCAAGVAVTCEEIAAPFPVTLWLRPRVLVLGAGCNRGVNPAEFESCAMDFLKGAGVSVLSLKALASIDIKKSEPALVSFAERHNIPFMTFAANELQAVQGKFTGSEQVRKFTGTDNVCERASVLAAGEGAVLMRSKCVYDGITFALSRCAIMTGKE
ncbi:MAG: cobalt-precorrin 5A hydrolase [Synergistaceae bacterium]|nr:cobalt-precorrin 5A hydrolase [Synergistaceae bacterium]